jgi:hypothetical protein
MCVEWCLPVFVNAILCVCMCYVCMCVYVLCVCFGMVKGSVCVCLYLVEHGGKEAVRKKNVFRTCFF